MKNIVLYNASEEKLLHLIQNELVLSHEDADIVIKALCKIGCSQDHFHVSAEFPPSKPGTMSFMIMINKYNINVTKSVLSLLAFLLGLTPIGTAISIKDLFTDTKDTIACLSDNEKAMLLFLRGVNESGEFRIQKIYDTFVSENNNEYTGINSKKDIDTILDALADKELIEIRTQTIKVLK